jgi:hypothetical protein
MSETMKIGNGKEERNCEDFSRERFGSLWLSECIDEEYGMGNGGSIETFRWTDKF